ncbi:hypothetical protein BC643_3616 [Mangrovibacterium diazotrophicum]|uniref:Uncharacterized protein n=1 Tax=Mangrovibacterium diazotrophicum TaxID=1261403 RepID=A0A419VZ09_9BACT|nr:hypothetical protein BC643_3616 [Mangrovibacterium diazotrophicum]
MGVHPFILNQTYLYEKNYAYYFAYCLLQRYVVSQLRDDKQR